MVFVGFVRRVRTDGGLGGAHGTVAGVGEAGSEHTGGRDTWGGLEGHSYAAILLAAFVAALLGLLLGVRRWRETGARRLVSRLHCTQVFALRAALCTDGRHLLAL